MMSSDTTVDLSPLEGKLPYGWAQAIRERLNGKYSIWYIKTVVRKQRWNEEIALEAVKLAEETVLVKAELQSRVDAIAKSSIAQ